MLRLLVALALTTQTTAPDPLLTRLVGVWSGEGTVLGQPARVRMEWAPTLDDAFVRLTFVNEMGPARLAPQPEGLAQGKPAAKSRRFEGHAYYRATADNAYRGIWVDNSGAIRPIEATRDADVLVARWGTPQTEEGETTYRLVSATRMEVVDRVKSKDGSWREFGRVTVSR